MNFNLEDWPKPKITFDKTGQKNYREYKWPPTLEFEKTSDNVLSITIPSGPIEVNEKGELVYKKEEEEE